MMNKKQLAKVAAIAGGILYVAPQIMPLVPPAYHPHAGAVLGLLGFLAGYPMQSPFSPKAPLADSPKRTIPPPPK